jgi:type VI protein secretion system component Hcp
MQSATKIVAGMFLLLWATLCFAWEQESNEFQFPISGVSRGRNVVVKDLNFSSAYNRSKNAIVFSYSLPPTVKEAVLNIYSIKGSMIKTLLLKNDVKTMSWNMANEKVAVGTYAVSLKCGAIEKNQRILIVK